MSRIEPDDFRELGKRFFPGLVGLEVTELEHGRAVGVLELREQHMACACVGRLVIGRFGQAWCFLVKIVRTPA